MRHMCQIRQKTKNMNAVVKHVHVVCSHRKTIEKQHSGMENIQFEQPLTCLKCAQPTARTALLFL